jgi:acetyl esterase
MTPVRPIVRSLLKNTLDLPSPIADAIAGPPPINDRGSELDRQAHMLLKLMERTQRATLDELGPEAARAEMRKLGWLMSAPLEELHRIEDRSTDTGIRLRIYTPRSGSDLLPATVYYHGGGFVLGDLDSHDAFCRQLALGAGTVVVAVDYRLAPEHPFPSAVDDAVAAFRWAHANARALGVDASRMAVAGDSAGGNLAAVVAQTLKGESASPSFQLLIYPATDLTRSCDSHRTLAEGYFLTAALMDWFVANYLTDKSEERDVRGSPLAARELGGLPPAHVVTAGFDPLRDEGEAYASALIAAGVPTTLRCYETLIHAFVNMNGLIDAAEHAVADMSSVLRQHLWP